MKKESQDLQALRERLNEIIMELVDLRFAMDQAIDTWEGHRKKRRKVDGKHIRALMKARRVTYKELADSIGYAADYVEASAQQSIMHPQMIEGIARFFNVTEAEIEGRTE